MGKGRKQKLCLNRKTVLMLLAVLLWLFAFNLPVRAEETGGQEEIDSFIWQQMADYDLTEIENGFADLFPGYQIDMDGLLSLILKGKVTEAVSVLGREMKQNILNEFYGMKEVIICILVIGIISSLFSNFSDIFSGQQISQVGFYFLYLFLMAVLTRSFVYVSQTAVTTIENIVLFVKLFIPTWFMAVGASSGSTTAVFYYQVMLLSAYLIESFLLTVLMPFVYSYVILALLNGIWAEERLALLLDFIKKAIIMALKVTMGIITGLSMVQAVIVPVVDKLKISAFRKAVSAIPGVGGVAEGVTELVIGAAVLIKNSLGVLLLVLLLFACLTPLIKILMVAGLVKLGAALTGIISDKRISGCTDRVGEGCFLLFRCVFTAAALFLIIIGVVAYTVK
ncbi:MAG: stage III sporulation protein AE [Lachnospiraceae bacterium]|nr:stage III sporulation protein AE [Lachnospiraceae bacterium]